MSWLLDFLRAFDVVDKEVLSRKFKKKEKVKEKWLKYFLFSELLHKIVPQVWDYKGEGQHGLATASSSHAPQFTAFLPAA